MLYIEKSVLHYYVWLSQIRSHSTEYEAINTIILAVLYSMIFVKSVNSYYSPLSDVQT